MGYVALHVVLEVQVVAGNASSPSSVRHSLRACPRRSRRLQGREVVDDTAVAHCVAGASAVEKLEFEKWKSRPASLNGNWSFGFSLGETWI